MQQQSIPIYSCILNESLNIYAIALLKLLAELSHLQSLCIQQNVDSISPTLFSVSVLENHILRDSKQAASKPTPGKAGWTEGQGAALMSFSVPTHMLLGTEQ